MSTPLPALLACLALLLASEPATWPSPEQAELAAIESESHALWRAGERDALAVLLTEEYLFVAMNGAVERREEIVGPRTGGGPPALRINALSVQPDEVVVRGDTAIILSLLEIDATVRGRPLPPQMRILSAYVREDGRWQLLARSITPILAPAAAEADR
jgi:ketosteroid isomerase-like protein